MITLEGGEVLNDFLSFWQDALRKTLAAFLFANILISINEGMVVCLLFKFTIWYLEGKVPLCRHPVLLEIDFLLPSTLRYNDE